MHCGERTRAMVTTQCRPAPGGKPSRHKRVTLASAPQLSRLQHLPHLLIVCSRAQGADLVGRRSRLPSALTLPLTPPPHLASGHRPRTWSVDEHACRQPQPYPTTASRNPGSRRGPGQSASTPAGSRGPRGSPGQPGRRQSQAGSFAPCMRSHPARSRAGCPPQPPARLRRSHARSSLPASQAREGGRSNRARDRGKHGRRAPA